MLKAFNNYTPPAALTGSMRDFRYPKGSDLEARVGGFFKWQNLRRQNGLWPFSRSTEESPSTVCAARDDAGGKIQGVNFASQDYLSMSTNPVIKKVAQDVIEEFGVHSAGSAALLGNTHHSVLLERKIADFLGMPEAILFPTGWAAGYGVIKGLVRSTDHIVMDSLAHTCLQEGASAATRNIYLFRHNMVGECRKWLEKIRAKDKENGIMVVIESLYSMDSDTPDIGAMQALCDEFDATLMVDVAHDLGNLGDDGRGHIGMQGMLGKVDLVMGSFSKTFGSNGGFVGCRSREVKEYLRFYSPPCTFSNALSPMQAATVLKAFEIIESVEGAELRNKLMTNVLSLRRQLVEAGFEVYGDPSAIVCVKVGTEGLARLVSRRLPEAGLIANLVEFPAVPKGQARFRMQVMANHTPQNIRDAVLRLKDAYEAGLAEFEAQAETPEQIRATA
ncbi:aminotransferase class I/II-fold pyridoxal phosphate-dependent enzyme [Phenylobacterium sp. J367]|uniref:aminotransferase class I/II-fold pyridoxal phosphate-dependent enzyme n=1 Tax=Phenylobacterium sp. J367 TaxID=2898435 RepID=UPI002150766F|nr:aminotransferase class I/II-fold pyridoxal phosphate-dependent enzyme [Phenylobacterium sp. J367]MCR5878610.1 aminotransferase class I/II-fold pyridoxal phosphate-dependent enzyme [Phenylobacterium sp. J367]